MKAKEKRKFTQGMGTMLITLIGIDLFRQGSWFTCLGLSLMVSALIIVYLFIKPE